MTIYKCASLAEILTPDEAGILIEYVMGEDEDGAPLMSEDKIFSKGDASAILSDLQRESNFSSEWVDIMEKILAAFEEVDYILYPV